MKIKFRYASFTGLLIGGALIVTIVLVGEKLENFGIYIWSFLQWLVLLLPLAAIVYAIIKGR